MTDLLEQPIKDFVTADHRTASVFEKYGIDFCCRGQQSLSAACANSGADTDEVIRDLNEATASVSLTQPVVTWELDTLANYIVATHHKYVRNAIPDILAYINKVALVHGGNHPETINVRDIFTKTAGDLLAHMQKEEMILFPMISALAAAKRNNVQPPQTMVAGPISVMNAEHESAGDELADIRRITNNFSLPPDACTTYRVAYQALDAFEKDLHTHVHLENAILFPKAIELESKCKM